RRDAFARARLAELLPPRHLPVRALARRDSLVSAGVPRSVTAAGARDRGARRDRGERRGCDALRRQRGLPRRRASRLSRIAAAARYAGRTRLPGACRSAGTLQPLRGRGVLPDASPRSAQRRGEARTPGTRGVAEARCSRPKAAATLAAGCGLVGHSPHEAAERNTRRRKRMNG